MSLFYSDVDDTIISKHGMSQRLQSFLKNDIKKEDHFIPCSGRPVVSLINLFENLNVQYVIGYNGGQIYDLKNKETIFKKEIPLKDVQNITNKLEQENINYIIYTDDFIYSNDPNDIYCQKEAEICNIKIEQLDLLKSTPKILGLINPDKADEKIEILQKQFKDFEILKSKPYFIEITPKKINKGEAIIYLSNKLKVENKNIYCFGDSDNDIPMFKTNYQKIAVENANQNIKKLADEITDSCEDDGVLNYIKKIYKGDK